VSYNQSIKKNKNRRIEKKENDTLTHKSHRLSACITPCTFYTLTTARMVSTPDVSVLGC